MAPSPSDNQLTADVDGLVDGSSTKKEESGVEVDGQNRLYEILERELQVKNEQIAALQIELSKERQHSREQAEKIAMLADQAQHLQLAQMQQQIEGGTDSADKELQQSESGQSRSWWRWFFGGYKS